MSILSLDEKQSLDANSEPRDHSLWFLIAIILVGLALRLVRLDMVLWGDEVASWAFARRQPFSEMLSYALQDPTPPVFYIILHFLIPLIGDSAVALRFPSLLAGVAILPVIYWCMRQASFSKTDALLAAFLAATSSVLIYYSQEARAYSMLVLWATLSIGLLHRCLHSSSWRVNILYGLVLLLLSTTSYYGLVFAVGEALCLLIYRRWRSLIVSVVVILLAGGLIVSLYWGNSLNLGASGRTADLNAILSLINTLTVGTIGMRVLDVMANGPKLAFPIGWMNGLLEIAGLLLFVFIFYFGVRNYRHYGSGQKQFLYILLFCLTIPIGISLLLGSPLSPRPQWLLRGLLTIWPLFFMITVISIKHTAWRPILILGILILNGFSLATYYSTYIRFNDQPMFDSLSQVVTASDLIVVDPWYMYDVVDYYYDGPAPMLGYSDVEGWLDVGAMSRTNEVGLIHLEEKPKTQGDIYVYYRRGSIAWANIFPSTLIFTFDDPNLVWREIDHTTGEWKDGGLTSPSEE